MRRLLQCGLGLLLLAAVLVPIVELFDQWDPPGLADDTELSVFGLVLLLSVILVVAGIIASLAYRVFLARLASVLPHDDPAKLPWSLASRALPQTSPPLRI